MGEELLGEFRPTVPRGEVAHTMLSSYRDRLEDFVRECERLVDGGMPYLAVTLCHELVRYLYPHEPVLRFTHDDPLPFINNHISSLIDLARRCAETVRPYPPAPADGSSPREAGSVPTRTSTLYSSLWQSFDRQTLEREALELLTNRIPREVIESRVRGMNVLDMGCGSGRYTLALSAAGAARVTGVDYQARAYAPAVEVARSREIEATFVEGDVLNLPFPDESFDFVFCNGVIHHTTDILRGLDEYRRVLKRGGAGFLYIYGSGGVFWHTRARLRPLFAKIPYDYTQRVFEVMGVPANRFIFCDTWYVPIERHTTKGEIEGWLSERGLGFRKVISQNPIDLDSAIHRRVRGAEEMWGDGDHRYLIEK